MHSHPDTDVRKKPTKNLNAGKHYEIEDNGDSRTFVVTGPWGSKSESALLKSGADTLILNYARGFQEPTLDFLDSWPIRHFELLSRTTSDITPIYRLSGTLETLALTDNSRTSLDYSRFSHLKLLAVAMSASSLASIQELTQLEVLALGGYTESDFTPLCTLLELRQIYFTGRPRLESLRGVERFTKLRDLTIAGASRLTDISALSDIRSPLIELDLQGCKNFSFVPPLDNLTELKLLNLGNIGEIESFRPLAGLSNLESLRVYESTRPVDNDLSPLLGLRKLTHLGIQHRRAYSPTAVKVKEELGLPPR